LHLRQLIRMPASNRMERLVAIAEPDRKLIEERLEQWDRLGSKVQLELLENEWAIRIIARSPPSPLTGQITLVTNLSPQQRQMESEIIRWNALPPDHRQRILERFQQFFDELNDKERARVLNTLSADERQQMERTLQDFEKLPKGQRDRCIAGFQKFADLSPQQRQRFLKNAEQWQSMNEKDRALWRTLVSKLSSFPPLPTGVPSAGAPPLPSTTPRQVTNR